MLALPSIAILFLSHYAVPSELEESHAIIQKNPPGHPGRTHLYFALSKAYDDLGEYEKGFHALSEGNRLRKMEFNYTIETDRALMTTIKEFYIDRCHTVGSSPINSAAVKPLFIVGMPRSGTTIIEQILSSHTQVFGADELIYMPQLIDKYFGQNKINLFLIQMRPLFAN